MRYFVIANIPMFLYEVLCQKRNKAQRATGGSQTRPPARPIVKIKIILRDQTCFICALQTTLIITLISYMYEKSQ